MFTNTGINRGNRIIEIIKIQRFIRNLMKKMKKKKKCVEIRKYANNSIRVNIPFDVPPFYLVIRL